MNILLGVLGVILLAIVGLVLAADRIADRENRKRQEESEPR